MLLNLENMYSINYSKIDVETNFEKKLKIKSLVAWPISEGRVDKKQIINFVRPYRWICESLKNLT